jgi:hypothetical protein
MKKLLLLCSVLASVGLPIFQATAATSTLYCTVQSGGVATAFTISSAVLPFSPINPSYTGGSITFTMTDIDGDGALLTESSGSALLDCLINGTSYHRLGSDPYSLSVPPDGSTTVTLDFGTPIPSLLGPAASDIQTSMEFILSPRDRFSASSFFTVDAMPASAVPDGGSSGALLVLALGAVAIWRATLGNRVNRS